MKVGDAMMMENRYVAVADAVSRAKADAIIAWLREYAERRINSRLMDERRSILPNVILDFGNQGLLGLQVETKFGGLALRNRDIARVVEQVGAIDLGLGVWLTLCLFPGMRPLVAFASNALKEELLPQLARGRILGGYAQTETSAGTDFTRIGARAVPQSDGSWRLSGDKIWIGNGSWSGVLTVIAHQCTEDGDPMNLAAFVVRTSTPGVVVGEEFLSMGLRGMVQNRMSFRNVHVAPTDLLGNDGEDGVVVGVDCMMFTRLFLAALALGSMKRCMQVMLRFGERRVIGPGSLIDKAATNAYLGELAAKIRASEAFVEWITRRLDAGESVSMEPVVACKVAVTEYLGHVVDRAVQLLGCRGYDETSLIPQHYRDARVLRVAEGATEPMLEFLGTRALTSGVLEHCLRTELRCPALADKFVAAIEKLASRNLKLSLAEDDSSEDGGWKGILGGELTVAALILGCLESRQEPPSQAREQALEWARRNFETTLGAVLRESSSEVAALPKGQLAELITGYRSTIGEIDQLLPGENLGMDPLLRMRGSA